MGQNNNISYRLVSEATANNFEATVEYYLLCGWELAGGAFWADGKFYQPMVTLSSDIVAEDPEKFKEKYKKLDPKLTGLLEINRIILRVDNGEKVLATPSKVYRNPTPAMVLMVLKQAKHCPIDLDTEWVINELSGILLP